MSTLFPCLSMTLIIPFHPTDSLSLFPLDLFLLFVVTRVSVYLHIFGGLSHLVALDHDH